jgi:hypothetical protein
MNWNKLIWNFGEHNNDKFCTDIHGSLGKRKWEILGHHYEFEEHK